MTLEELKQAMIDAKAKADATPTDKALQKLAADAEKAYNDAKAAADAEADPDDESGGNSEGNSENVDESKLDESTKKYIAKLRKENASHRTKTKDLKSKFEASEAQKKAILKAAGIEDDSEKPEEALKTAKQQNQTQAFRNAILESAIQHGIPGDQIDYYEFLITKATNELDEGEELEDDKLAEIVAKVKKGSSGKSANSTVNNGGKTAPPPGGDKQMTLEKFCALGIIGKSKFFTESPSEYERFMNEAKKKKMLV